jgi:putative heme-binding domain-containing protein
MPFSLSRHRRSFRFRWLALAYLGLTGAHAQTLPEGNGKAEFQRTCGVCHSLDRATSQRMTRTEWAAVVNDMVARGAQGSSADLENIVNYLSDNYGKNAPSAPAPRPPSAANPATMVKAIPLSPEQQAVGQRLVQQNGCLTCHRVGGVGSYLGPSLEDAGAHRSAEQLKTALISPHKNLAPENRTVEIVTGDGKSLTGRLLNQDGFSVQFIDSQGQLRSVDRLSLRSFSIQTTNPMPSYEGRLSTPELDSLVTYLSGLKGGGSQ